MNKLKPLVTPQASAQYLQGNRYTTTEQKLDSRLRWDDRLVVSFNSLETLPYLAGTSLCKRKLFVDDAYLFSCVSGVVRSKRARSSMEIYSNSLTTRCTPRILLATYAAALASGSVTSPIK